MSTMSKLECFVKKHKKKSKPSWVCESRDRKTLCLRGLWPLGQLFHIGPAKVRGLLPEYTSRIPAPWARQWWESWLLIHTPTHTRSFDWPFRCLDCPDNPDSRTFLENHLVSANCPDNPKLSRLSRNCALSGNIKNIPKNLETDRMAYLKEILLQVSAFGMPFLYCKFVQPILRTNLRYDEIGV